MNAVHTTALQARYTALSGAHSKLVDALSLLSQAKELLASTMGDNTPLTAQVGKLYTPTRKALEQVGHEVQLANRDMSAEAAIRATKPAEVVTPKVGATALPAVTTTPNEQLAGDHIIPSDKALDRANPTMLADLCRQFKLTVAQGGMVADDASADVMRKALGEKRDGKPSTAKQAPAAPKAETKPVPAPKADTKPAPKAMPAPAQNTPAPVAQPMSAQQAAPTKAPAPKAIDHRKNQHKAGILGIPANGTKEELQARLDAHDKGIMSTTKAKLPLLVKLGNLPLETLEHLLALAQDEIKAGSK